MRPLPHSYTNDTRGDGAVVVKRYDGPQAATRRARERLMLHRLRHRLPVPRLLGDVDGGLRTAFVAGVHGQELIEAGHAEAVLRTCGRMLRRIHEVDPAEVLAEVLAEVPAGPAGPDLVLVHGDYGPNNLLLDPRTFAVTAVVDWEWAHPGDPLEDLAWCGWIVRMHHGEHVGALGAFFDGYGHRPAWTVRHDAMLARCRSLLSWCQGWADDRVRQWEHRLDITARWTK